MDLLDEKPKIRRRNEMTYSERAALIGEFEMAGGKLSQVCHSFFFSNLFSRYMS